MAQPVIPLQPYIQGGEGNGSAFILPDENRMSAAEAIYAEREKKRQQQLAEQKLFQQNLLQLGKAGGKGLTKHRQQFAQEYQGILDWIQQQRMSGKDPYNPTSAENFELQRKMNDLSAQGTIMGEAYDYAVKNKGLLSANPKKYDTGDWNRYFQQLGDTDLKNIDTSMFKDLKERFDKDAFLNTRLQRFPQYTTQDRDFTPSNKAGILQKKTVVGRDREGVLDALLSDKEYVQQNRKDAFENNSPMIMQTFAELPEVQDAVKAFVKTSNGKASGSQIAAFIDGLSQDKNFQYDHDKFQNNLDKNLAIEHAGPSIKESTTYEERQDEAYLNSLRNANKEPKPQVSFKKKILPAEDLTGSTLFGPNKEVTVLEESTPSEGENKPVEYHANSGYVLVKGNKLPVPLKHRNIDGKVIRTYSAKGEDGTKTVYAEIEGQALTNEELYPEMDWGDNMEKYNKPKISYYVPLTSVAKNQQAEYEKYNKTDYIKNIEQAHGINYKDFLTEEDRKELKDGQKKQERKPLGAFVK